MKRLIGMLLSICLLLVGCSYNSIENIQLQEEDQKIEIEFWYGAKGYSEQLFKELIEEFNAGQNDYYIRGVNQLDNEETFRSYKSAIARKEVPSVVLLENQHIYYLASKGILESLNDYQEENKLDDFIESYLEQNIMRDELYGIPMYGTTSVLYYRKDFLEKQNIKTVDLLTWEAFSDALIQLTQKDGNKVLVYGWEMTFGAQNLIDAAISNGGNFLDEEGKKVEINDESWVESWEFFRRLIHDEELIKVHYGGDSKNHWYATVDDVLQGRAAGYIGSCGDLGELDLSVIGTYLLPSWSGKLENPRAVVNLESLCIPSDISEEEKEGAYTWIKFLTSQEVSLEWVTKTGYLPVRKSSMDEDAFYSKVLENPDFFIPVRQVKLGTKTFIDPTDGEIYELLEEAARKVLVENIPAKEVLDIANDEAQFILDELLNKGR